MHVKDLPPGSFLYDKTHAVITESVFDRLLEYSTTTPTGKPPGKLWKTNANSMKPSLEPDWYIRFITECYPPVEGHVLIHSRRATIIKGA